MTVETRHREIHRLLVANRGEIAVRVLDAAHELGLRTVAVYAESDRHAAHVQLADTAVPLGGYTATETYLNAEKLLDAALAQGADAVHPGYGFLSEDADFAQAVVDAGLTWVGPRPEAIRTMGDKLAAKAVAARVGVPTLPSAELAGDDPARWAVAAEEVGYPLLVKAAAGGGGRGMRLVSGADELADAVRSARREAADSFGNPTVFAERWLAAPRHVEVQVVGDQHGDVIHLAERDCSIQRRHQKLIEECPSPAVDDARRDQLGAAAVALAKAIGYDNVGTVEFLLEADSGQFWFLEMNTRIQVEHRVTEEALGCDLVWWQIQSARGEPLEWSQDNLDLTDAHAIEVRLYAEDPSQDWQGSAGTVDWFHHDPDDHPGVTIDTGASLTLDGPAEVEVTGWFDPLLAKVVARGYRRDVAIGRLVRALQALEVHGVTTNRDYLLAVLQHPDFLAGRFTTLFVADHPALLEAGPDPELVAAHVAVAWLHRARATQLASPWPMAPPGWRVDGVAASHPGYALAGRELPATCRWVPGRTEPAGPAGSAGAGRSGSGPKSPSLDRFEAEVDGVTVAGRVLGWGDDQLLVEVDGTTRLYRVRCSPGTTYVNSSLGQTDLVEVPRFVEPDRLSVAGGAQAPVPGRVVQVAVAPGDVVGVGATLVVLESMKVEHRVTAPTPARVAEVLVAPGDVVDAQQVLIRLEEAE